MPGLEYRLMNSERFVGNPIPSPNPLNSWEALMAANAGAVCDNDRRKIVMLSRAAAEEDGD